MVEGAEPLLSTVLSEPSTAWRKEVLRLAREHPSMIDPSTGGVVVCRYDEVERLARSTELIGIGLALFDMMGIAEGELRRWYGSLMFTNDGAPHDRLRRLVSRAFTPRSVERLRAAAAALVDQRLTPLVEAGTGDLVAALDGLPLELMARLIGLPEASLPTLRSQVDALSPVFGLMTEDQTRAAEAAIVGLRNDVAALIDARRGQPADDLLTSLLAVEEAGDQLSADEVVDMVANLLVGGHDTTAGQLGCTLQLLLADPSLLQAIRDRTATSTSVVSETMRVNPTLDLVPRCTVGPTVIVGRERPAGSMVWLHSLAANHDPAVWDEPETVQPDRFDRPVSPKMLTFGSGPHYCLGANLARMTLTEVVDAVARLEVRPTVDPFGVPLVLRLGLAPTTLPVTVGPAPVAT
jgi:cytochrome P450